ncbi:MAG: putative ABC transporter permease [Tissierella sp.]|uniref:putative ABC transporter permease n=1 Tax=Tissierella sp. TaxID=41274 RepID=UPI003F9D846B
MIKIKKTIEYSILFIIGGTLYFLLENLWRGYSHFSMFVLGGLCFISIGLIKKVLFPSKNLLLKQQLIACITITILELIFGLILNSGLGLEVWDYSDLKYNFMGQISLLYTILWFFLSLPTIILYDYLRHWMFKENKPKYKYI